MAIDRLEAAARRAMAVHPISVVFENLPAGFKNNPAALRRLLIAVAEGTPVASSPAYAEAHAALVQVEEAYALRDKIGALYNNPKVQRAAAADGHDLDYYVKNPSQIKLALRNPKVADVLGADLTERLGTTAIEASLFREEHGIPDAPAPAETPVPTEAGARESEIAALRSKSVAGRISKAESARLDELYAARIAAGDAAAIEERAAHRKAVGLPAEKPDEYLRLSRKFASTGLTGAEQARLYELTEAREAATAAPTGGKPAPDEYKRLIGRSVDGTLTPEENSRLNQLSGERAVASGAISREDLAAEQQE